MVDHPMLIRLAAYRLEQDLSYDALAAEMTEAGWAVKGRALHLALTARIRTLPRDRTMYKITQFVLSRHPRKRPAKRNRRAA